MPFIDIIAWEVTIFWKKCLRAILGFLPCLLYILFIKLDLESFEDQEDYIFFEAFPNLLIGFLTHGIMVVVCIKAKLIDTDYQDKIENVED